MTGGTVVVVRQLDADAGSARWDGQTGPGSSTLPESDSEAAGGRRTGEAAPVLPWVPPSLVLRYN